MTRHHPGHATVGLCTTVHEVTSTGAGRQVHGSVTPIAKTSAQAEPLQYEGCAGPRHTAVDDAALDCTHHVVTPGSLDIRLAADARARDGQVLQRTRTALLNRAAILALAAVPEHALAAFHVAIAAEDEVLPVVVAIIRSICGSYFRGLTPRPIISIPQPTSRATARCAPKTACHRYYCICRV